MIKNLATALLFVFAFAGSKAPAQTIGVPQEEAHGPVTMQVFYKVPPGKQVEWLNLYKKYHYPVMQQFVTDGILKSVNIYRRRFRADSPAWDYEAVLIWRDWAAIDEGHVKEPGLIRKMYPDLSAYQTADQRRFELTSNVWIDLLEPVPLN